MNLKSRQNILYLDHYAGSRKLGRSFRPFYLGQEWLETGNKLTVVGGSYSHLRQVNPKPGVEYIDGICYLWLWTPKYRGNGLGRVFSMLVFVLQLLINIPLILKLSKPTVIISSTVYMLDIIPAWFMKKLTRHAPKIIFELHDLWPMSPLAIGNMSKYNPYILLLRGAEKLIYKIADGVVSMLPNSYDHVKKFGVKKENFAYIPNGVVLEDWTHKKKKLDRKMLNLIRDLKKSNKFLIGYAGAHGPANALMNLLESLTLVKNSMIHVFAVGEGIEKEKLQQYAMQSKLSNITFLDSVAKEMIPEFLQEMDMLYIGMLNLELYRYGISPNKIFDYMMAEKPIISAIDSPNNPIDLSGAGFSVAPDNPRELAIIMDKCCLMGKAELNQKGRRGKAYIMKNHLYSVLAGDFSKFIRHLNSLA